MQSCHILVYISHFLVRGEVQPLGGGGGGGQAEGLGGGGGAS